MKIRHGLKVYVPDYLIKNPQYYPTTVFQNSLILEVNSNERFCYVLDLFLQSVVSVSPSLSICCALWSSPQYMHKNVMLVQTEDSGHQQQEYKPQKQYFPPQYLSLIPHDHRGVLLRQVSTKKRRQILMPVLLPRRTFRWGLP